MPYLTNILTARRSHCTGRSSRARLLPAVAAAAAALTLAACGGGGGSADETLADGLEVTRADVLAARTQRGQEAAGAGTLAAGTTATPTTDTATGIGTGTGIETQSANRPATTWVPAVTDTWQWQLTGTVNTSYNVNVYDVDLFDVPDSLITSLHAQGRRVVCYFSAGSAENWRSDYARFLPSDLGNPLDNWPGERWVDTRSANVREIMKSRLDKAQQRGCDGVEPDNVDAYTNKPGFPLTPPTQLDYNRFLAREAQARGLRVALKNDVDQLADLAPNFDFAVNEQCNQYHECGGYSAFTNANKPVFNAEYKKKWVSDPVERAKLCSTARAANLRTLVLPVKLNDAYRYTCD
jgi:hypothetical protein